MSEDTSPKFGAMKLGEAVVAFSPIPLPVIYFDGAPGLSHLNGIIGVTLTVTGNVPTADRSVTSVAAVVAHLKCNIPAAIALREALNSALLLAEPVDNPEGKAN